MARGQSLVLRSCICSHPIVVRPFRVVHEAKASHYGVAYNLKPIVVRPFRVVRKAKALHYEVLSECSGGVYLRLYLAR